jgi:hypothetical protein
MVNLAYPKWQELCIEEMLAWVLLLLFSCSFDFFGFAYQGKDIVFRFIIEYSSLRNYGPYLVGLFLYDDFWKMIFWLVLKLEIS